MHILGSLAASGLTPAELEAKLEDQLAEVFEGSTSATVEVAVHRPVIVGGQVTTPGSYPFIAGLDVAGAIALAQGTLGTRVGDDLASEMRVETEAARYALLRVRLAGRLVERARLLAERDGTAAIEIPDEANTILGIAGLAAAGRDLVEAHEALRAVRDEQLELRLAAEEATRAVAEQEAAAYSDRQNFIRLQLNATLEALVDQQKLAERGLALTQRLVDLRVSVAGYQADELEAVAKEFEARKTIKDAEVGKTAATVLRAGELAAALAAIDAEIAEIRADMNQAQNFVGVFGGPARTAAMADGEPSYRIRRRGPEGVRVLNAGLDTPLLPGDMLDVALTHPALDEEGPDKGPDKP